eukprot:3137087-Amphidinium_carterae.1
MFVRGSFAPSTVLYLAFDAAKQNTKASPSSVPWGGSCAVVSQQHGRACSRQAADKEQADWGGQAHR